MLYTAILARLALCSLVAAAIIPASAAALSLQQYFFELSDRERGAYVTGFLDFFVRDSARDAGYRECIQGLGPARLHESLTQLVRSDPSLLSYDAMSWLLYEGSRLCNQKGPRDLPQAPSPAAKPREAGPDTAPVVAPLPADAEAPSPTPAAPPTAAVPDKGHAPSVILLLSLAIVSAGVGLYLYRRYRHGLPAMPLRLRRRDPKRSAHSPG